MAKFTDVISALTESTDPQGDSDYIVGYDGSAVVKILIDNLGAAVSLDALGAPSDSTSLNSSTDAHGLLPKLDGTVTNFLTGIGTWAAASGGSGAEYILIQDQKAQNTAGGSANSPGWQTHVLNTEVIDSGNNASIASNQITLAASTYVATGWMRAYKCAYVGWKLVNVSDTDDLTTPAYCFVDTSDDAEYCIPIDGYFTIAAEKTIEAQYQCSTARVTYGLGNPSNLGTEIYLSLWLTKVG